MSCILNENETPWAVDTAETALRLCLLALNVSTGFVPGVSASGRESSIVPEEDAFGHRGIPGVVISLHTTQEDSVPPLERFRVEYTNYHGFLSGAICVLGILFNCANVVVLTRRSMLSPINWILTFLAFFDMLLMVSCLPVLVKFYCFPENRLANLQTTHIFWARYLLFHSNASIIFHTTSIWLTILLASFRYLTLSIGHGGTRVCNIKRAKMSAAIISFAVLFFCVPNCLVNAVQCAEQLQMPSFANSSSHESGATAGRMLFDHGVFPLNSSTVVPAAVQETSASPVNGSVWEESAGTSQGLSGPRRNSSFAWNPFTVVALVSSNLQIFNTSGRMCTVGRSKLTYKYPLLNQVNYWVQALLIKLVPCVLLSVLTCLLLSVTTMAGRRRIKMLASHGGNHSHARKANVSSRTTSMLLAIIALFLISELPQGVFFVLSGIFPKFYIDVYTPLGDVLDLLVLINNSINFVLYCTMSRAFRIAFERIFCPCLARQLTDISVTQPGQSFFPTTAPMPGKRISMVSVGMNSPGQLTPGRILNAERSSRFDVSATLKNHRSDSASSLLELSFPCSPNPRVVVHGVEKPLLSESFV